MAGVPYSINDEGIIRAIIDLKNAVIAGQNPGSGNMSFLQDGVILDFATSTNFKSPLIVNVATGVATVELGKTGVNPGTYTKVQVDEYGRVVVGMQLAPSDIPAHVHTAADTSDFTQAARAVIVGAAPINYNAGTGTITMSASPLAPGTYVSVSTDQYGRVIAGSTTIGAAQLPQATEAAIGAAKIATTAIVNAGADDLTIVTPLKMKNYLSSQVATLVPFATNAETLTGTLTDKAVTPAGLTYVFDNRIATTSVLGTTKIATQSDVNTGTEAFSYVTPATLKTLLDLKNSSESARGFIEIATQAEADAGTDDVRAITPLKLKTIIGTSYQPASEANAGATRYATQPETNTGTLDTAAITPLKLKTAFDSWAATNAAVGTSRFGTQAEVTAGTLTTVGVTPATLKGVIGTKLDPASETVVGVSRFATNAETTAGTLDTVGITPLKLASYFNTKVATETTKGTGEIATQAEVDAGTLTTAFFVTPATLKVRLNKMLDEVIPMVIALG